MIPTTYTDVPQPLAIWTALMASDDCQDDDWLALGQMPAPFEVQAAPDEDLGQHHNAGAIFKRIGQGALAVALVSFLAGFLSR